MKIGPPSFERHSCSYPYQSLQQSENKWCAESSVLSGDGEVQVSPMWANGGSAPRPFTQNMSCLVLLSTVYSLIKPSLLLWMPSPQSTLCIENWEDSRYYHNWNKVKILWEPWRAKQLFSAFPWYVLQHEAGAGHQAARGEVLPHLRPLQPIGGQVVCINQSEGSIEVTCHVSTDERKASVRLCSDPYIITSQHYQFPIFIFPEVCRKTFRKAARLSSSSFSLKYCYLIENPGIRRTYQAED